MKKIILLSWAIFIACFSFGQDIHLSQFFNAPQVLNPALTGYMRQDYRLNAIYRNQWRQANATFSTIAFGADANIIPPRLKGDKIGLGIMAFRDQMGSETITNNSFYGSLSYIKTLDAQKRHNVSIGAQIGLVQKRIDYSTFYFANQIQDFEIDRSLSSGENSLANSMSYINMNAGAYYNYKLLAGTDVHIGISVFNILKPKENFAIVAVEDDLNKLKNRSIINIGGRQLLSRKLALRPEILIMHQSKARDLNLGTSLEYFITDNPDLITVQAGAWYRTMDAVIVYGALKYHHFLLGLSYDITNSSLNDIKESEEVKDNANIGAFEINITYFGFLKRALPYQLTVPCKFF